MKYVSKKNVVPIVVIISLLLFVTYNIKGNIPSGDIKKATFSNLKKIRERKKQEIIDYFNDLYKQAEGLKEDKFMIEQFSTLMNKNYSTDSEIVFEIDKHFVNTYSNFYDILFVDSTGYIFFSIKQEFDYQKNLFEGELASTELSKLLKQSIKETFVGYEFYFPSDEPAAFYIIPQYNKNRH